MKTKALVVFFVAIIFALATVPVFGTTKEITYGVVLDIEGNGMEINIDTHKPIDPYYNYICYGKVNAEPGQIVYTIATTDENGEWLSRKDYPLNVWIEDPELNVLIEIYNLNQELSNLMFSN